MNLFLKLSENIPSEIPPIINNEEKNDKYVNFSSRIIIPKISAITGTNNWTREATGLSRKGKIAYHKEYPKADIIAPEKIASKIPLYLKFMLSGYNIKTTETIGIVKIKFDIVDAIGSFDCLPLIEYIPQPSEANNISKRPNTWSDITKSVGKNKIKMPNIANNIPPQL